MEQVRNVYVHVHVRHFYLLNVPILQSIYIYIDFSEGFMMLN